MAAAKAKLSQGELAHQCLIRSPVPIIDVGVNLADDCFDKVRCFMMVQPERMSQGTKTSVEHCIQRGRARRECCSSEGGHQGVKRAYDSL